MDDLATALQYIEEHHGANIASVENMTAHNEITWELLWALLTPQTMMYHYHQFTEQHQVLIMRRLKVRYRKDSTPYWHIMCDMIADDGLKFGYTKDLGITSRPDLYADLEIDQYEGVKKIQDLLVYPLKFARDPENIRLDLIERGKKYVRMVGHSYWETSGPAMKETMNDRYEVNRSKFSVSCVLNSCHQWWSFTFGNIRPDRFQTHGRVMIDTTSFRSYNPNWMCNGTVQSSLDRDQLTDDQLLICAPFVGGFGFGNKLWGTSLASLQALSCCC